MEAYMNGNGDLLENKLSKGKSVIDISGKNKRGSTDNAVKKRGSILGENNIYASKGPSKMKIVKKNTLQINKSSYSKTEFDSVSPQKKPGSNANANKSSVWKADFNSSSASPKK